MLGGEGGVVAGGKAKGIMPSTYGCNALACIVFSFPYEGWGVGVQVVVFKKMKGFVF